MQNKVIRERKHRLSRDLYIGKTSAAFTLCIQNGTPLFTEQCVVDAFSDILTSVLDRTNCIVPAYCFMPNHHHLIVMGSTDDADLWETIVSYKQKTGFWLSQNKPNIRWQKDFYDHIIRSDENLAVQIRYLLDNPVRKGLATVWQDYPFKGSVGCDLNAIAAGIS